MSGLLRGLIMGALAAPFVLLALAYMTAYFWTALAIMGGLLALLLLVAILYENGKPKPPPDPEPGFGRSARGAPLDPES